ncbi:hypothetical protein QAD02_002126 [Eretmocerus hayati]|uniref:Uncharacterized protein n=1 Tax=Eretmocerus hayati TaxID=131215 RepID=A0ACC2NID7_9HYME|nr:hypothetical protein QAD02_002126 [Eretmocerus hayati]
MNRPSTRDEQKQICASPLRKIGQDGVHRGDTPALGTVGVVAGEPWAVLLSRVFLRVVKMVNSLLQAPVLLPVFSDFSVNFTLEVTEGGCYQWSTSRPDIVRLIPIDENYDQGCSIKVIVQTVTRDPTRKTAIILAEDVNTGHFLRCDVIVDAIFSLDMVTTTRELFIEEAPEAFKVRAYDEQGNEFTTLAGVEFIGRLETLTKHAEESVARQTMCWYS